MRPGSSAPPSNTLPSVNPRLRFLLLETGQPLPSLRRHGDFTHWIRSAARLSTDEIEVVRGSEGETPASPSGYVAALVTGSAAMVTDREVWSEATADWLRHAADRGLPLLGICYGHQLIAQALGGRVDFNPRGREMGTVEISLHDAASEDPLFRGLPRQFAAQTTHQQTVLAPPPESCVLARSALDDCQAFRWRQHVWGLQFHPEFATQHMRGYIQARREALQREGRCHRRMLSAVRPTPLARRVLRRFVALAAGRLRGPASTSEVFP